LQPIVSLNLSWGGDFSGGIKRSAKFYFFLSLSTVFLSGSEGQAQFTFATDNAANSAYSDGWANGDNGGTGFNPWSLSIPGASAGVFIGNPSNNGMGTTGIGTTAFGLFSSANNSGYVNATRDLTAPLGVGDTLSFYWAMNWDSGASGAKGFDLKTSGGANVFNVNNGGNQNITAGGVLANSNYGISPMLVNVTRTTNGYEFSMTARNSGGSTYTTNVVTGNTISRINLYEGNQADGNANRNIYFNNFSVSNSGVFTQGGTITNGNTFSGSGNLSVGNNTALVLNGAGNNNYTGTTTISNGSSLNLAGAGTNNYATALSGSGNFIQSGSTNSRTVLTGNNSSFSGKTTIDSGTLSIDSDARLGSAPGSVVANQLSMSNGTLETTAGFTLAKNRGITLAGLGTSTLAVNSGELAYDGVISGTGALGKNGSGTLKLTGASTYSGFTYLRAGTILVGNDQALGSGTFMFSFADNSAKTLATVGSEGRTIANAFQIYNNLTLGQSSGNTGSLHLAGNVSLGNETGTRILTMADGTSHTISGVIDGLRGIVKSGGGTLTLSGNNTFSGANYLVNGTTMVTANTGVGTGTLNLGETSGSDSATLALGGSGINMANAINVRAGSSGVKKIEAMNSTGTASLGGAVGIGANATLAANSGGALALTGATMNFSANTILTVTNSSSVTFGNQLITSGDALIAKRGNGTLSLASGSNYGDMRYDLYGGTLEVSQVGNLGDASSFKANKVYFDGGKLRVAGTIDFGANNGITLGSNGGTIEVDSGQTLGLRGYINDIDNTGVVLTKTGAGVLLLNRGTSYDLSGTTLRVAEGVLDTWNPTGNLSATTELGGAATTGTFRFTKSDGAVTTDRNFQVNAGGGKINVAADALTVSGGISGAGAFAKEGAGTLILTGSNSVSGATSVTGGKLVVNGSLLQSAVTVQTGATLGGSGTVGALTVASGGTLAVGNSPGLLTAASATWNPGSTFQFEIANATGVAGTDWDLLSVSGNLNLTTIQSTSKMNLLVMSTALQNYNSETSYSWVFAQAASISADGFSWASGLDVTDWFALDSTGFNGGTQPGRGFKVITGTDGGLATLSLQAVPEPGAASLILIGLGAMALGRRFRR
jgi:autotransporter-associated beta strand protein